MLITFFELVLILTRHMSIISLQNQPDFNNACLKSFLLATDRIVSIRQLSIRHDQLDMARYTSFLRLISGVVVIQILQWCYSFVFFSGFSNTISKYTLCIMHKEIDIEEGENRSRFLCHKVDIQTVWTLCSRLTLKKTCSNLLIIY